MDMVGDDGQLVMIREVMVMGGKVIDMVGEVMDMARGVMKSKFFLAIFFQAKAFLSWCFYKSNLNPCFQRNTHLLTLRVW